VRGILRLGNPFRKRNAEVRRDAGRLEGSLSTHTQRAPRLVHSVAGTAATVNDLT
jgi:hypothetical protein